ncbi:MAG: hypothetical protein MR033_00225 [Clostridiales bacterium]|nr:hypothetical protein [Clostridiales bacterium]
MRGAELLNSMELVDFRYVEEADTAPVGRPRRAVRWAAAACLCLCLAAALAALLPQLHPTQPQEPMDGAPGVTVNGQVFLVSPHLSGVSQRRPEGFAEAGTLENGALAGCTYYLNPDIPEWVYVCQSATKDGTLDETGAARTVEPYSAYVRYVDARLRGRQLVCCNGVLYISLWSADSRSEEPDVLGATYERAEREYGVRIEAGTVEGFAPIGTADFSGDDTVPSGALSSNVPGLDVWADPAQPDVLLTSAVWYTAGDGTGQQRHTGFDVYVRWVSPFAARYAGTD